MTRLLVRN